MIHTLKNASPSERSEILAILNGETPAQARAMTPFFERYNAFEYSYDVARDFAHRAHEHLAALTSSDARESLGNLAEFVIIRTR